jgi:hypothetical protein
MRLLSWQQDSFTHETTTGLHQGLLQGQARELFWFLVTRHFTKTRIFGR